MDKRSLDEAIAVEVKQFRELKRRKCCAACRARGRIGEAIMPSLLTALHSELELGEADSPDIVEALGKICGWRMASCVDYPAALGLGINAMTDGFMRGLRARSSGNAMRVGTMGDAGETRN